MSRQLQPSTSINQKRNFTNRWDLFDLLLIQWNCLSKTFGTFELRQRLIQFLSWVPSPEPVVGGTVDGGRISAEMEGKLQPWTICLVVSTQPNLENMLVKMGSSSPGRGENKKCLKQPPSHGFFSCGENSFQRF